MKKIGAIHTFEDQGFLRRATHASLAVLAVGVVVAALWYVALKALSGAVGVAVQPFELPIALGALGARLVGANPDTAHVNAMWWVSIALVSLAALVVHELVHGFFFRQFAPAGSRVTFGANLKLGMLYASAEGILYTRQQYVVIALAPSVVVTALLLAIGIGLKWPLWTIAVVTLHLSGCSGDWGYVRAILRDRTITHCEDTSWGVEFYGDECVELDDAGVGAGEDKGVEPVVAAPVVPDAPVAPAEKSAADKGFSVVDGGKSA